jgi:hypothetical protein
LLTAVADKWNRHVIVVNEDMVAFIEVPSNVKQFFHDSIPQAFLVLVFLKPDPHVCEKPQAVAEDRVAQHLKCDSPTVMVLVGQMHMRLVLFLVPTRFLSTLIS